jgi:DNA (cytosine-5)-methyltransferase 1
MAVLTHGSLFSGIGGFDLAATWMDWENIFHCEWNTFGQQVLKHHFPKSISYNDITKTDFTIHKGEIDILTGGFPCQPYSLAGKRKGKDDERHLWPEMLRAIREIQPRWVVGENVFGLINWSDGLVFHEVQTDLEAAGYEVWPYVLPACAVNAPHRRDRVWFVAYSKSARTRTDFGRIRGFGNGCRKGVQDESFTTNPHSNGFNGSNSMHEINASEGREHALNDFEQTSLYTNNQGLGGGENIGIVKSNWQKRNEQPTRHVPSAWQNFPTQPPICFRNDGLPAELDGITFPKWRNESIKAAGNAIVPQVALQIFKSIEQYILHLISKEENK